MKNSDDDTAWMVVQNKDGNLELVFVNVVETKEPVGVETNDDGDENLKNVSSLLEGQNRHL